MRPRTLKAAAAAGSVAAVGLAAVVVASDPRPDGAPLKPPVSAAPSTTSGAGLVIPPTCPTRQHARSRLRSPGAAAACTPSHGAGGGNIAPSIGDAPPSAAPDISTYVS